MDMYQKIKVDGILRTIRGHCIYSSLHGGKFDTTEIFKYDNGKFIKSYMDEDMHLILNNKAIFCSDENAIITNTQDTQDTLLCDELFKTMIKLRDEERHKRILSSHD